MTENASTTATAKRPKGRSPLYPSINLETAILRARQLYDQERQHATAATTIATHWGYKSLNGPAAQTLAALKKYGLLIDEGAGKQRRAKISTLADVIIAHPDEAVRKDGIQEAALKPAMIRELWEKYHNEPPSDSNLRWELTHNRGFTETGATEFLPVYRATISFAQLASRVPDSQNHSDPQFDLENDNDGTGDSAQEIGRLDNPQRTNQTPPTATKSYAIPLIDMGVVTVSGNFPITQRDWNQFKAVLEAMRPGLVADDSGMTE